MIDWLRVNLRWRSFELELGFVDGPSDSQFMLGNIVPELQARSTDRELRQGREDRASAVGLHGLAVSIVMDI